MEGNFNLNSDADPDVEQPFFTKTKSHKNDSIGNNSGGIRSNRDEDFVDMMDDFY
jgi:hypothetical protein